ncbi:hypothetical protein HJFPF1_07898 [Paramyrothecium foliicola]|nr:hypothetical protein HJFPF1_07898 [Paramyrothecium foliicola]
MHASSLVINTIIIAEAKYSVRKRLLEHPSIRLTKGATVIRYSSVRHTPNSYGAPGVCFIISCGSMPPKSYSRRRSRHSDPPATPLGATPERTSLGSRAHSLSPRKRDQKQPLHIRLNLTENQMDKITDAFAYKVNNSPKRHRHGEGTSSNQSHIRNKSSFSQPQATVSYASTSDQSAGNSTTFSELMSTSQRTPRQTSLAERRHREAPPPIEVGNTKPPVSLPRWPNMESVSEAVSPLSSSEDSRYGDPNYHKIVPICYSEASGTRTQTQSLNMPEVQVRPVHPGIEVHPSELEAYNRWARVAAPFVETESGPHYHNTPTVAQHTPSIKHGLSRLNIAPELHNRAPAPPSPARMSYGDEESPLFSPLPLYFRGQDFPSLKKGEKTLIGQNGWLERTGNPATKEKKSPQKKGGIIDSIKKIAKDMTEIPARRLLLNPREQLGPNMVISLDSREQSLLYCELEFHLTNALNEFIIYELDRGRLDPDKLKKIADSWYQLGRPRVVGFRYDLETQLELVHLHIGEFVFHGRRQGNPVEIAGLLQAMRTNARAMRVRTFCQPDSVIAKQLVDSQSLFNLINAEKPQQMALAEIAQFFKVILERELDSRRQQNFESRQQEIARGDFDTIRGRRA